MKHETAVSLSLRVCVRACVCVIVKRNIKCFMTFFDLHTLGSMLVTWWLLNYSAVLCFHPPWSWSNPICILRAGIKENTEKHVNITYHRPTYHHFFLPQSIILPDFKMLKIKKYWLLVINYAKILDYSYDSDVSEWCLNLKTSTWLTCTCSCTSTWLGSLQTSLCWVCLFRL